MSKSSISVISASAFLAVAIGGLSMTTIAQQQSNARAAYYMTARKDIDRVFLSVQDAETGQRGYLITHDDGYLRPYNRAFAEIDKNFADLHEVVNDQADRDLYFLLYTQVKQKMAEIKKTIDLAKSGDTFAAEEQVRNNSGMYMMREIREIVDTLKSNNLAHLDANRDQALLRSRIFIVTNVLIFAASLLFFVSIVKVLSNANAKLREESERRDSVEKQLRQSQKMEAVGQLTGGLAHDLNNMLMGVIGMLDMIERQSARNDLSKLPKYIGVAKDSADRAAALTNRLLAFSRRATLTPEIIMPCRLARGMVDFLHRTLGPNIQVEVTACSDEWTALVDKSALENSILNLCLNSRDAMPAGGRILIDISVKRLEQDSAFDGDVLPGEFITISVTDTGTGMSEETCAHIFEPFFTTKVHGQGTGLGLSQVYGFAKQSGGQVRVHSKVGIGTTIRIMLPRIVSEEQPQEEEQPVIAPGQGQVVLVVDDEPAIRDLIEDALTEHGYRVLTAHNASSALEQYEENRIGLLLTDIGMPGLNGRQLAELIRGKEPALPVVFMTGFATQTALADLAQTNMTAITKPFRIDRLLEQITRSLG